MLYMQYVSIDNPVKMFLNSYKVVDENATLAEKSDMYFIVLNSLYRLTNED